MSEPITSHIVIGQSYRFAYPIEFVTLPEYSDKRNSVVKVLSRFEDENADPESVLFNIVDDADGWTGQAWEDELKEI